MPVIVVTAAGLTTAATSGALVAVNAAAATALGLPLAAVHSLLVPASAGCTGDQPGPPWPTAVLHGRAREPAAMRAATEGVAAALAEHWHRPGDQVWVQWALTG